MLIFGLDLLTGVEKMNSFAWPTLWSIDEHIHVHKLIISEPSSFQGSPNSRKITAPNKNIDIAGIANGPLIRSCYPFGNGVASSDCILQAGRIECLRRPTQAAL